MLEETRERRRLSQLHQSVLITISISNRITFLLILHLFASVTEHYNSVPARPQVLMVANIWWSSHDRGQGWEWKPSEMRKGKFTVSLSIRTKHSGRRILTASAHCDTLFSCALEIFLLTYLLKRQRTSITQISGMLNEQHLKYNCSVTTLRRP